MVSRRTQPGRTLMTCSKAVSDSPAPHPLIIVNRLVIVPYPHSSRSTHTSSTILAAQFMLTTPLGVACYVVSIKLDFLFSFSQFFVPSWVTTSPFTDPDSSLQLTFRKIKFNSSFPTTCPFYPIGRSWLSKRV